jgi:hypothetical protein
MMDPASVKLLRSVFHADFAWAPMGKSVQGPWAMAYPNNSLLW